MAFYTLASSLLFLTSCVGYLSAESRILLSAQVGSSAVLPCDWKKMSSQNPHVEWRTITEIVFERRGEESYQGEGYEHRVDVPKDKLSSGNCSLLIQEVKLEDAGIYESYLVVPRVKRSLQTKRVFLQSVELSVEGKKAVQDLPEERAYEKFTDISGGAQMNSVGPHIIGLLFLCLFCWSL